MRTFEYRLYPTKAQEKLLMAGLSESRKLYNEMLLTMQQQYEQDGTFPSKYEMNVAFKGRGGDHIPASTVQMLSDRLSKALKRYLAAKHNNIPGVGFPRFKQPNRWHSIQLRQYKADFQLALDGKHLAIPKKLGGSLKIKLHRPIEGTPKTAHLVLRADVHWYALIVCETEPQTEHLPSECSHPDIGIDVGLKSFLTDSEGNTIENPRYYLKIKRQRRDHRFKVARQYAEHYQVIAVEDLQITNMVQNHHLAKSIVDAGWGQFLDILTVKAENAGHGVVRVNPRFTSQRCYRCGEMVQKSLSVRTHICPSCGYVEDRDVNAAKNILKVARRGHRLQEPTYPVGDCVS